MFFKDLILSHPELTQKQWATWLEQSDGAIRHYSKGEGSPDIDRCVRGFPKFPEDVKDSFLAMFPRLAPVGEDPVTLACEAMRLTTSLCSAMTSLRGRQAHSISADRLVAAGEAIKRTIDNAVRAATPLCARGK